jgi:phosphoribosylanthranilate isomerase
MVRVKICGLTSLEDAAMAVALGADALGFVFAPSPRQVSPELVRRIVAALPPLVLTVGVFMDESLKEVQRVREFCGLDYVQLHGALSERTAARLGRRVIKAMTVEQTPPPATAYPKATLLLDAPKGRPRLAGAPGFDWKLAQEAARRRPVILAGGLNPDNVRRAVETVRPFAVDVSSGVEKEPGRKDHARVAAFIARAKALEPAA